MCARSSGAMTSTPDSFALHGKERNGRPTSLEVVAGSEGHTPQLGDAGVDLRKAVENFENQLIRAALDKTNWNKKRAAELLGINRTTLVEMLKRKRIEAA
jgi:DNA-binding NtrC family response regulator